MEIKFFPRDVISGKADKAGDEFQAKFLGQIYTFKIVEHLGNSFLCQLKGRK